MYIQKKEQIMNKSGLFSGICTIAFSVVLPGCDIETQSIVNPTEFSFTYDLEYESEEDAEEWEAVFADYPVDEEDNLELSFSYDTLPEDLPQRGALRISGNNLNGDLFMFLRKQVSGLKPSTAYSIIFNVEFASQYPESTVGTGGSHGASVALLVGAMRRQPDGIEEDDAIVPNFDHRTPFGRGQMTDDVLNMGNIGIPGEESVYTLISRSNEDIPFMETTDKDGKLWVMVGIYSGFEGTTTLFYDQIGITFRER